MTDADEISDGSFYDSAWKGVERAKFDLAATVTYAESVTPAQHQQNFQYFAEAQYDIVVTAGYGLLLPTLDAAEKYQSVRFIGIDQEQFIRSENFSGVVFPQEKAGFMAGALAGTLTRTDTVGAVLGTVHSPTYRDYRKGFEAGAKGINPKIKIITLYHPGGITDGQTDPVWGASAATFMLENKADVVFAAGGETAAGALVEVAQNSSALCIGAEVDQFSILPDAQECLISSALRDVETEVFFSIASTVVKSQTESFEGGFGLAPYHNFDPYMTADARTFFDTLKRQLESGVVPTDGSYRFRNRPEIEIPWWEN